MNSEFEIVRHSQINYINLLFNKIKYRAPHMHQEFEIIYNLGGDVTITVDTDSVRLPANTFVVCNANHIHEIQSESATPFMICLQIAPAFFQSIYPQIDRLVFDQFYLEKYEDSSVNSLLLELAYAYLNPAENYEFHCCSLIYEIFAQLLRLFGHHLLTDAQKKVSNERTERINRVIAFANEHYAEKICLADLARQENLSVTYLSRFIKTNLNRSFQDYIGELRLRQARHLIRHTDKSLLAICEECGYSNYRYLYQAFRSNYHCSPKHYRDKHPVVEMSPAKTKQTALPGSSEHLLTAQEALAMLNLIAPPN